MSKEGVSFKNRDRFIQLGIAISTPVSYTHLRAHET